MMQCPTASFRAMPPALTVKPRLSRHLLLFLLLLLCMAGFGYIGFHLSEEAGIRQLRVNGERQLELHARAVESEINRYTYLPSLLELESSVSHLLLNPTPYRRNLVNDYLEGLNRRSGARAQRQCDGPMQGLQTTDGLHWAQTLDHERESPIL